MAKMLEWTLPCDNVVERFDVHQQLGFRRPLQLFALGNRVVSPRHLLFRRQGDLAVFGRPVEDLAVGRIAADVTSNSFTFRFQKGFGDLSLNQR